MYLLETVGTAMTEVIKWVRKIVNVMIADTGYWHELLPLFVIGVAISAVFLGIKIIRSLVWGT